jgi:hypothetical protein
VRTQIVSAASTILATAGELTARSLDAAKTWTAPFGQAASAAPKV